MLPALRRGSITLVGANWSQGWGVVRRRRVGLLPLLIAGAVVCGCSPESPAAPASSAKSEQAPQQRAVALSCEQAGSGTVGEGSGPSLTVGSLTIEGPGRRLGRYRRRWT
jgi:hypothetical protein